MAISLPDVTSYDKDSYGDFILLQSCIFMMYISDDTQADITDAFISISPRGGHAFNEANMFEH